MRRCLGIVFVLAVAWTLSSCAKPAPVRDPMDNPPHHYRMGMEAIERNNLSEAETRFDRALTIEKDYPPALAGKALVAAMRAGAESDAEHREVEWKRARGYMDDAVHAAEGDTEEFIVYTTAIRVYSSAKPSHWLMKVNGAYDHATGQAHVNEAELPYYQGTEAAHYFAGVAYYEGLEFRKAEDALSEVTAAPTDKWHEPATKLFEKVHEIVRASAKYTLSDVAKEIAIKDEVNRADVAALLVDELKIDKLMRGRIAAPGSGPEVEFVPADILDNPFKTEILELLKWNVRGLQTRHDVTSNAHFFYPDKGVRRVELAFILEDLLIKLTGDESMATQYYGNEKSAFVDVPPTSAYYNAVTNVVSRDLMNTELNQAFRPNDPASGAELLLAVLRLRDQMNIY